MTDDVTLEGTGTELARVTLAGLTVPVLHGDGLGDDRVAVAALFSGGVAYCRRSRLFIRCAGGFRDLPAGVYLLREVTRK